MADFTILDHNKALSMIMFERKQVSFKLIRQIMKSSNGAVYWMKHGLSIVKNIIKMVLVQYLVI